MWLCHPVSWLSFGFSSETAVTLLRDSYQAIPGTFKCSRARSKTCFHSQRWENIGTQAIQIKITEHFTCTSANVIYCITCTLCKKFFIGETGKQLSDRFRKHLRDVEKDDKNSSRPVTRHFYIPQSLYATYGSLRPFPTSRRHGKTLEQKPWTKIYFSGLSLILDPWSSRYQRSISI